DGFGSPTDTQAACDAPTGFSTDAADCDDTDDATHPGATDAPYDGVDQDCAGGDPDDLDGDGFAAEAAGGEDCDDGDGTVFPGAVEGWGDGLTDNNCDGSLEPVTLEYGSVAWTGWRAGDGLGRQLASAGDLDGDGLSDVIVGSEIDSTLGESSGALYRVSGTPGGSLASTPALLPGAAGQLFGTGLDAGVDVTDDGVPDLLVSAPGTADTRGVAWLVDGAAWVASGSTSVDAVAAGQMEGSRPGSYGPSGVRFLGDVDGDGVGDIALGECCGTASGPGTHGRIVIVSQDRFEGSTEEGEHVVTGPWENAFFGYFVDALGDVDGDGLGDVLVSGTGGMLGAVVPGNTSGDALDVAITTLYGEVPGAASKVVNAGDLDGDGRNDVAVTGETDGVSFFTALTGTLSRNLEAPSFRLDWAENGGTNTVLPLGDLDGDGRGEAFVPQYFSDSGTQRAWLLLGSDVRYGGSMRAEDTLLSAVSLLPTVRYGYTAALADDVDGDGTGDIVIGAPSHSIGGEETGGATLIPLPR
ncbi:MAG: integrin alpha, partial [Myxococcota bacterium]